MRSTFFYIFLAFHSLLIGLFPFFLPVYLFRLGFSISVISLFIGLTGLAFCTTLFFWDRIRQRTHFFSTILASFIIEVFLLLLLLNTESNHTIYLLAFVNGVYNCLFWIVQRILFASIITSKNSGRNFGNFQIFVLILLKIGIFTGGFLLESYGFQHVIIASLCTSLIAIGYFYKNRLTFTAPNNLVTAPTLLLKQLFSYKDRERSLFTFSIDGVFLYLESYFWVLTLFLLVDKNFWQLGLLVIALTIIFSVLFFIIKNKIDTSPKQIIYSSAVILYSLSWFLRGSLSPDMGSTLTFLLLILITFSTSYFRLAFNKRFFDLALSKNEVSYILVKSYVSQFVIFLFFTAFAILTTNITETHILLRSTYFGATILSPLFFLYRSKT